MFTNEYKLNHFVNLIMYKIKPNSHQTTPAHNPGFLCKGTATKVWRELVKEGVGLKQKWSTFTSTYEPLSGNILSQLGGCLFDVLKGPDLTVPALIKDDPHVDMHSVYSQYLYEYMFRMKNISKGNSNLIVWSNLETIGRKPTTTFTFLSESELRIKQAFEQCLRSVDDIAHEIAHYDEVNIFMNLRWYCDAFQKAQNSGDFLSEKTSDQTEVTNRLSNQFNSYYTCNSEGSTCASTQFKSQIGEMLKVKELYSNLNLLLTYIFDTVTFHCKLTSEIINEIDDEMLFLQEYDKRWNAYVASMIKFDEILTPLGRIVNKVYKRLCPGYPMFPNFSFMRLFIIIWKREVYKFCKESIEDDIVRILKQFHKR